MTERNTLISADVFEQNFSRACREWADICYEDPRQWLERIVPTIDGTNGLDLRGATENFARTIAGYDYISPGYNGFHLLPLLGILRSGHRFKILFIAHAPVQHIVELSLITDLLRPDDVIVCPSLNARQILCNFYSGFSRNTVVIPHCIEPLPRPAPTVVAASTPRKLVSLGRITEDKLIHRQIDAMALLKEQGRDDVIMVIAGPCQDESGRTLRYVHELKARISRLGLEDKVIFCGALYTEEEKGAFLADAAICISLSRAEEESFGKSCAEAICMGIPVITTNWNGLPETVGKCGEILPVHQLEGRQLVDIHPADCARAIVKLLNNPPAETDFSRQRQLFASLARGADYKNILFHSLLSGRDAPCQDASADFFNMIPAIRAISLTERKDMYLASLGILAKNIGSTEEFRKAAERWRLLTDLIFQSGRARGKQLLAHQCGCPPAQAIREEFWAIPACPEHSDKELCYRLLSDCLLACDSWARELTLTSLTAVSPPLATWCLAVLKSSAGSSGFLLIATVNSLMACGEPNQAAGFVHHHLASRDLLENDATLLLYSLHICQRAGSVTTMTEVLNTWLAHYPDAPRCSSLWPILAANLIVHGGQNAQAHGVLAQLERIVPDFDTTHLRSALTAMDHL